MSISKVGGVIAAAGGTAPLPLRRVGAVTAIKRIVQLFQQAGVFPIVVVTGVQADEVRYQLSANGVVFLVREGGESPELMESVKAGLGFLQGKCDRVVFSPVNVPLFSPATLRRLIEAEGAVVTPSYHRQGGHPVVLDSDGIPHILAYSGSGGLRGAISAMGDRRRWLDVADQGILYSVRDEEALNGYLEQNRRELLHPVVNLGLGRGTAAFGARSKLLLLLIDHTHSVRSACGLMALSYSKAWDMLNQLEEALGYPLVQRRHGGRHGGRTDLTEQGLVFLREYQSMEENICRYAGEQLAGLLAGVARDPNTT